MTDPMDLSKRLEGKPWAEIERRWEALTDLERNLVVSANQALADSTAHPKGSPKRAGLVGRSDALHEAARHLRSALNPEEAS